MPKTRCEICNRTFKDEDGLAKHNAAKHSATSSAHSSKTTASKKLPVKAIVIVVCILVLGGVVFGISKISGEDNECKTMPATEMNIGGHTNLKLHKHAQLRIIIDGEEQIIPADIGIYSDIMRPLHTHDATGKIHIEGPCQRDFKLVEFFNVWNQALTNECIFNYCTNNGTLKMTVNGRDVEDIENYYMKDFDNIKIEYSTISQ